MGLHLDYFEGGLGWREILLALVFLLALYMLFELLRLRWLRKRRAAAAQETDAAVEPVLNVAAESEPAAVLESAASGVAWNEAAHLAQESFMRGVEYEMVQMRDEIDALRAEHAVLRGEFSALREQLLQESARLRAAQTVSPIYSDAMQMAVAGHDAGLIAERCGISRAEADLVVALVNHPEN